MEQEQISPIQALNLLYRVSTLAALPKQDHDSALQAAQVLERLIQSTTPAQPEPEMVQAEEVEEVAKGK